MFKKPTTLILGAGASYHYGYPTGEQLIEKVIRKSRSLTSMVGRAFVGFVPEYMNDSIPQSHYADQASLRRMWDSFMIECSDLADKLEQINPLVIDYFLGHYPGLQRIGKLMIAWVILECEAYDAQRLSPVKPKESAFNRDWLRYILAEMLSGCASIDDLVKNRISFVTFNYDVSLEQHLYARLCDIELFKGEQKGIKEFLAKRVFHVYGSIQDGFTSVAPIPVSKSPSNDARGWISEVFNRAFQGSQGINVIDPVNKDSNKEVIEAARKVIGEASTLYILGYGFDDNNNDRLKLSSLNIQHAKQARRIFFTNYQNQNKVNKKAGQLFFGSEQNFMSHNPPVQTAGTSTSSPLVCEKSTQDVYSALAYDF